MSIPPDDGDGPWVPGFPDDSEHFRNWIGKEIPPPHHEKWDEAIQRGLDFKTGDWEQGRREPLTIEFQVIASKRNPGWIDGYRAVFRP